MKGLKRDTRMKIAVVLFSIFCLLLTACGTSKVDKVETSIERSESTSSSSVTSSNTENSEDEAVTKDTQQEESEASELASPDKKTEKESVTSDTPSKDLKSKYIGLQLGGHEMDTVNEMQYYGGSLLTYESTDNEYAIHQFANVNTNQQMIWFAKLTHRDSEGRPFWVVLDVLLVDELQQGFTVSSSLVRNEQWLPGGVGIVNTTNIAAEYYDDIPQAWQANWETGKFEEISIDGLRVINEGHGC